MTPLDPALERELRRYVLGTLEEDARVRLEEQLVKDPEVSPALGVVEDELIEDYLDGALTEAERRDFERHFLRSPAHARLLTFFEGLRVRATSEAEEPVESRGSSAAWFRPVALRPAWLVAAAAVLVLSLGGHVWMALRPSPGAPASPRAMPPSPPAPRLAELIAERHRLKADLAAERQRAETLREQLERARSPQGTSIPTFTLGGGALREAGSLPEIVVPLDASVVGLRLDLPADEYPFYRAILHDAEGGEIWSQSGLTAEETPEQILLEVLVPTSALAYGDYQVKVSGLPEHGGSDSLASFPVRAIKP
jgi:hypothetical protein